MSDCANSAGGYGRFAMFIDGSNFYHTLRDLNLHVDYRRMREFFCARGELVRAHYYTALLEGNQTPEWLIRLTAWLSYNGYAVITKRARVFRRQVIDEYGVQQRMDEIKGDIAVELTVDMLSLAVRCDTMFLFSGNGDFLPLIRAVQDEGCRVVVVSSDRTTESTVADELRRQADCFLELTTIVDQICMLGRKVG
ncbi:MAG: NYN domain-containing protein [Ardenticatenaceae bacterium]